MCQKGAVSHSEEEQLCSPLSHELQGPEMNPACHRQIEILHFQQYTASILALKPDPFSLLE